MTGDDEEPVPLSGRGVGDVGTVVWGGTTGIVASGSPYARSVGDIEPAFATTFGVAEAMSVVITDAGLAVGAVDR